MLAMRVQAGSSNEVYYVLKDHLGSASAVTNASGDVVGEQRYDPFGATRWSTGSLFTDKLYTGQREMEGLGIYHYQARFYSPALGRFLSPDTIIPGAANPQSWNRYSYVTNNPLRYTDPTGHMLDEGDGGNQGGVNCKKYPQYCTGNKPKSQKELAEMRPKRKERVTPIITITPTVTYTPTVTPTPPCTSPNNSCATQTAGQATYVAWQPTMLAWQCQHYQCLGNLLTSTPTSTPTYTPIPNDNLSDIIPHIVPSNPLLPDFAPNADAIWDIIGSSLPLLNIPATSLSQIFTETVNVVIQVGQGIGTGVVNIGTAVNEAIGNGPYFGPVMPIFYIPSPYDLFPVSSPQPMYN